MSATSLRRVWTRLRPRSPDSAEGDDFAAGGAILLPPILPPRVLASMAGAQVEKTDALPSPGPVSASRAAVSSSTSKRASWRRWRAIREMPSRGGGQPAI